MPEGWTPPVGWKPDPSWPKPPSGWPLWVADDEFVISPYRAGASGAQAMPPWYRQTAYIVLLLIFFFPLGLVLLWLRNDWPAWARGIVTGVVGIFALIVIAGVAAGPPTPTALSSTGAVGTSASPHAVASSRSASPSPVVTTPAAPVTSAAPKTTAPAPAPVHTSAAPVYVPPAPAPTTQAPAPQQPAQTTEQAQQSCYPLTSGGNCYKPGEYCRKADRSTSGIDAEGDAITCEDNDGWRWEQS
jgi:hypothetical protein